MNPKINVLFLKIVKRKISVRSMPLSAKGSANFAITVTHTARTSFLAVIIAPNWIKLLLSAMAVIKNVAVGWIKHTIRPPRHTGSIKLSLQSPGPVSTFLPRNSLHWMNSLLPLFYKDNLPA